MSNFSSFQYRSRHYFIGAADAASYRVSIREYRHCYAAAATRRGNGHRYERYVHGSSYRGEGGSRGGNVQRIRADSGLHRHAKQGVLILEPAPRVPHVAMGVEPLLGHVCRLPRYHLVHKHHRFKDRSSIHLSRTFLQSFLLTLTFVYL